MHHYFSNDPDLKHDYQECSYTIGSENFIFLTDSGVFSKGEVDKGSDILLRSVPKIYGNVLDLGCGYGLIGIVVKKNNPECMVTSIDINFRAVALCIENAKRNNVDLRTLQSDGLKDIQDTFDTVFINPPIRAGKATVYRLFAEIKEKLNPFGKMYTVIRTKQGAKSAIEYLKTLYCSVNTIEIKAGYRIIVCNLNE